MGGECVHLLEGAFVQQDVDPLASGELAALGLGAAPPTGVSAFGSRIATSGGLSQGGAVGTVAGSESFPISAFLSSPPPHAADSTSRKQMKEKQIGREGLSDLIIVGRIVS